jgi:molecular chaperone DnaJ
MVTKQDYYAALEIERTTSKADIKKAYLRLARKYHPDVNKEAGAEARFKEVKEAYEVLSDDDKRAAYDRYGHAAFDGSAGMGGSPFGGSPFGGGASGSPFEDLFESFFGGGGRQSGPPRGADLQTQIALDFEEAIFGASRDLNVTRMQTCQTCNGNRAEPGTQPTTCLVCSGTGQVRRVQNTILGQFMTAAPCERCHGEGVIIASPCHTCNGEGRVRQTSNLTVTVPAGIEDDATLRLSGQGEAGPRGGAPGNLYVRIRIRPKKGFTRQGKQIHIEQTLDVAQAALGDEIEVPTVDGPAKLKVPAGAQTGQTFRLRGHGAPDVRGGDRGDQIVTVKVQIPTKLNAEQRALFEQLGASFGRKERAVATADGKDNHQSKDGERHGKGFFERVKETFIGPDDE